MRVRAVLFDVDGTLLDSNDAQAHAWLDALRGHGIEVPFDLVRSKIGLSADELLRDVGDVEPGSALATSIVERRLAIFRAHYLPDLGPLPGARALVDRLRSRGVACVALGGSTAAELADLLREAAVADLIETVVTAEDVEPGKDPVEIALERVGVDASEAVLVGDTPYDVAAGARAGVAVVALRSGGRSDRELARAVAIYDGPADLVAHFAESPLALGVDESSRPSLRARPAAARGA